MQVFQVYTGLGAGNIGDELMSRAFWDCLGSEISIAVPLAPESVGQHAPYPERHTYLSEQGFVGDCPALLVGATPVTEAEGLDWPLRALAPCLLRLHRDQRPVDAVGVGVDHLQGAEARRIFQDAFAPIRSWTVRSPHCVQALRALGVPEARIRLGADWAWLYAQRHELNHWAAAVWRRCGVDLERPLLVANVVNMFWRDHTQSRQALASALAMAAQQFDLQLAFFCNESRSGEFFDAHAAREIGALTGRNFTVVPNEYYSPDEALSLLKHATVTVGLRYHFVVESVLAGAVPVGVLRGQKMETLAADLPFPVGGTLDRIDRDELLGAIRLALEERSGLLARLATRRRELARRARNNLSFLDELPPYENCRDFALA